MKVILQAIRQTILWTIICGIAYPAVITVIAQLAFKDQANGSLVMREGKIIGSALLAQQFTGSNYFWPRPSACSYGTGPGGLAPSSGSNLGGSHTSILMSESGVGLSSAVTLQKAGKLL